MPRSRPVSFSGAYRPTYATPPSGMNAAILKLLSEKPQPIQSVGEGVANQGNRLVSALMARRLMDQDIQERQEREDAFNTSLAEVLAGGSTPRYVNPDTGTPMVSAEQGSPRMVPTPQAGGTEGMISALRNNPNPDVMRALSPVLIDRLMQPPPETFETVESPYGRGGVAQKSSKTGKISGYQAPLAPPEAFETVHNPFGRGGVAQRNKKTGQITGYQAPKEAKERRIVKGADGRNYYSDTGEPVLPGVKTPQEKFEEMLREPGDKLKGGEGEDVLMEPRGEVEQRLLGDYQIGGEGGDAELKGGESPPTVRELFFALPPEVQAGIRASEDPLKAFSSYMMRAKGLSIETNPDGTVKITTGGGASGMTKKTTGDIEGRLVSAKEGLARLDSIREKFKPEYQEIPTRFKTSWTALKAKLGKTEDIPKEDRALLTDFASYKRDAIDNINRYIKDITGAQMSEAEAKRLRQGVPDPGEGIFGGDDPISFQSKLDGTVASLKKAEARYRHYLNKGLDDTERMAELSPLGDMKIYKNPDTGERIVNVGDEWEKL